MRQLVCLMIPFLTSCTHASCQKSLSINEDSGFQTQAIGPRTYFIKTASGKTPTVGSHSGAIRLSKGLLVIDTHANAEVEAMVMAQLTSVTQSSVIAAINTHIHEDHVGGNAFHISRGTSVYAHPNALGELKKISPATKAISPEIINELKKQNVDVVLVGHAHSVNDVVIYDRQDQVLYMGDMFVNGYIGYLGEAEFAPWIKALEEMSRWDVQYVVAGHGPLGTVEDLKFFRQYLIDFVESAKAHFEKTGSTQGYVLPEKYQKLGAQFYLEENVSHAFLLWQQGRLNTR